MAQNLDLIRALERAHEGIGCGIASLHRITTDLKLANRENRSDIHNRVLVANNLVTKALQECTEAQFKLGLVLQDQLEDMYTGWCGHRAKNGFRLACGCGTRSILR